MPFRTMSGLVVFIFSMPARFIQPVTWPFWGLIIAILFVCQTLAYIFPLMYSSSLRFVMGVVPSWTLIWLVVW